MNCGNCGNPLEPNATVCRHCGTPVAVVNTKKGGGKIGIIIALIVVFLAVGIRIGFMIGKSAKSDSKCVYDSANLANDDKKDETKEEDKKDDDDLGIGDMKNVAFEVEGIEYRAEDEYSKNFEVLNTYYSESRNYLYVLVKNNNTIDIDYTFYLNYLDETGTRVDRGLNLGYVEAGKKFVVAIYNSTADDFKSVNLSAKARKYKSYYHTVPTKESELLVVEYPTEIVASYSNKTKNDVSMYLGIIYYKDNKIVALDSATISKIKVGDNGNAKFHSFMLNGFDYSKENYKEIYDRFEIFISAAYYVEEDY